MDKTPTVGLIRPSNDSSPINTESSQASGAICPLDTNKATAMGRSSAAPSFFISAGARLTVIRRTGKANPLFLTAVLTLSFASLTATVANPTISKDGNPLAISVSTVIKQPFNPNRTAPYIRENMNQHSIIKACVICLIS